MLAMDPANGGMILQQPAGLAGTAAGADSVTSASATAAAAAAGVEAAIVAGRERLASLRDAMVRRVVQRCSLPPDGPWPQPELRALPDAFPPLAPDAPPAAEMALLRLLVAYLLDAHTKLPVEVEAMHRRVGSTAEALHWCDARVTSRKRARWLARG
jgi:hypothetical protein